MSDLTSVGVHTAQAAESVQRGMLALFEVIQASGRTGKHAKKLYRRLLSVEGFPGPHLYNDGNSEHLRYMLQVLNSFKEWTNHSLSHYLHESDSGDFDISEKWN
ncbi:uncharacterized protein N7529_007088 [Penicillium soppii]|uniref:uncharacterized protein n=1 Tax=Penicillium soppii TaxID=69789 RepID=UPI002549B368|nr:uncharacterized protein N7529_007088 [Penicillium soppii]KAJ5865172.1 hypothetical protein N7529_007088 [Penicillium soppii]